MRWRWVVFALVLFASLAANGYLLLTRSEASEPARREPVSGPTAGPAVRPSPPSAEREEPARPVPPEVATLDRAALENRLAAAEATLEPMLPIDERFERRPRSPDAELQLERLLDKIFEAVDDEESPYELECHGRICRVQSDVRSLDWRSAMQTNPDAMGLYQQARFGPDVYVELTESETAAGIRFTVALFQALAASTAVADCRRDDPTPGSLELALRFAPSSRRVSVIASGSLEKTAFGVCIRKRFEQIVAATPVPSDVTRIYEEPFPVVNP